MDHRLLLRVVGYRRQRDAYRQLSYAQALNSVGCQSVEATVRQRCLLFAGAVIRQPDGRLPEGLMFGELVGGENSGRGQRSRTGRSAGRTTLKRWGRRVVLQTTTNRATALSTEAAKAQGATIGQG